MLVDVEAIHKDILTALPSDPVAAKYLAKLIPENSCWS
jgi:hypothetical protein